MDKMFCMLAGALCALTASAGGLVVAEGRVTRSLDMQGGHLVGLSYKTADGTEFMRKGSPEFAFRIDGRMYHGWSVWKDVAVERGKTQDGGNGCRVKMVSADGQVGMELTYTTYSGLALVRKTLAISNRAEKAVSVTDVDVETFRLASLGCTNSRVMRHFGRYREEGCVYIGDWNDPLVVVHDYAKRCGIAVGNEGVSTMKRTTAFQDGNYIVSGAPHVGERYPFKKRLGPGERWEAMPVFTAPYAKCPDPSRVVEGPVSDYVRKHMGVRVEAIAKKPMFVYNTWVPFTTHIDAKLIRELADAAAECGIEEFVIDDGWQINVSDGKYGRGDWAVDEKKFPGGLKPTFDYIKSKGMRPGLWLSLAWADPASAPMKEHPEWFVKDKAGNIANLHTSGGSTRTACMATPWREYIRDKILGLVRDHGLAYVKLDLAIATSAYVYDDARTGCYAKDHPGHAGHEDSFEAIYASCMKLFDELHEAAPDLFIDCTFETAGKTFLMDYGIAKHAEGNWLSNIRSNEDGQLYVRSLAWGRTPALPATSLVIGNLHMNGERHLLAFKSLAGTLPIMLGDPRKLTPAERAEYRAWSAWLKELEARHGIMSFRQDLPGFGEPQEGAWDGFARINTETKSGGLVGVFRHGAAESSRCVTVRGLDPERRYAVLKGVTREPVAELSGRELEDRGFRVEFFNRIDGELFEVVALPLARVAVSHRPAPEGIPGAVLVTADADGEPRFDCVGEAAPGKRMEPDTMFWMASNTKGVVAALVLNLVSEGVLSLDDRVEKYFPSWKGLAVTNRPTLRMLLCHTTGLDVFPKKPIARPGMDALAEHVHVEPLKFEPDTNYLYSNWDIDVAAAIVEKATGRPFDVEMAERIFKPLGMTDSTFIPNASQNARRATFYRLSDGKPPEAAKIVRHKLAPPYMEVGVYPEAGGGLLSTPRDMAKFFQMVARGGRTPDGRVLISAPLMAKWAVKQTPPCVKVGYSFGMKVDGKGSLFHGGVGGTWAEVNVKTRKLRLYMANFEGKCKAAAAFKNDWLKSSKLVP